ncbi:MAG: amidohydrolase family protein [Bdellovibrionota bacterium]
MIKKSYQLFLALISMSLIAASSSEQGEQSKKWILSGYLHSSPTKRVFLTIEGNKIVTVSESKPDVDESILQVKTDDLIFPGLIDMHGHIKYNILPLWDRARGQFKNRFEWREKFPPYKDAVSFNMRAIKGDSICSAVRWAEIKALSGGITSFQGIGGDKKCAKDFGIHNLELPNEYGLTQTVRGMTDMVMPGLVRAVFEPLIAPLMSKNGITYDEAYLQMLHESGVTDWVNDFVAEPHNLANGLKLLVSDDFGVGLSGNSLETFNSMVPKIKSFLAGEPHKLPGFAIDKQIANMSVWLFGAGDSKGYLAASGNEAKAYEFLTKGGVLTVDGKVRRYIGQFETGVRKSAIKYFNLPDALGLMVHLSEGQRKDAYNRTEYKYAKKFGLAEKGLVIIHGVGLDDEDFKDATANDISIVWSPFSNLLLYGETLDVEAARSAGVNLAIGADWSPTGSKTLLDELKIARRYLDREGIKSVTNKDLVNMATINAARAVRLDHVIGKVEAGYQADLLIVKKKKKSDPYKTLIQASQADVKLVVLSGEPAYGDRDVIEKVSVAMGDASKPEAMPLVKNARCGFQKALRSLGNEKNMSYPTTAQGLSDELTSKFGAYAEQVKAGGKQSEIANLVSLDPVYSCEDDKYNERFARFVEDELEQNARQRGKLRVDTKLLETWNPLLSDGEDSDEEEAKDEGEK